MAILSALARTLRHPSRLLSPALLVALGFGFALVPLAQGRIFFYWDNAHQHYAQTAFLHRALRSWTIPQWDPAVGFGFPIAAEGQAAHYHPARLFFAFVFSPPAAMMWEVGFCFALAGIGTYLFLREFRLTRWACVLGGTAQMFCGVAVIFVRNVALHRSIGLLPFGMLLAERVARTGSPGAAMGFGVVTSLQLLSGHPTMAMVTMVGTSGYLFARILQRGWSRNELVSQLGVRFGKAITLWVGGTVLGFALAAIQVLPMLYHTRESIRAGGLTFEYAVGSLSSDPGTLAQTAFPYAFEQGDRVASPTPESPEINVVAFSNMYVGILPLLLAGVALWCKRKYPDPTMPLAVGWALATAFALGPATPLFPALWSVPGLGSMRYPSRFLLLSSFHVACLGAIGLNHLVGLSRLGRGSRLVIPTVLGGVCLGVVALGLWVRRPEFHAGIAVSAGMWVAAGLLLWLLARLKRLTSVGLAVIVAVAVLDQLVFRSVSGYASTYPIGEAVNLSEPARFVKQDDSPFRVMPLVSLESGTNRNEQFRNLLMANLSSAWGIDSADAWGSLFPRRYYMLREELVWELRQSPESASKLASFMGALNIKYAVNPTSSELIGWDRVFTFEEAHVWRNPEAGPRVFLVGRVVGEKKDVREEWEDRANRRLVPYRQMVVDWWSRRADAQIVDRILEQGLDFQTTAVVDGSDWPALPGTAPQYSVRDLTDPREADSMRFQIRTDQPGLMVIANTYAPGWSATVNGIETEIVRTNWIVQGLFVSEGESDVLLTYRAPGWLTGLFVSFVSIVLLCGLVLWPGSLRLKEASTHTPTS